MLSENQTLVLETRKKLRGRRRRNEDENEMKRSRQLKKTTCCSLSFLHIVTMVTAVRGNFLTDTSRTSPAAVTLSSGTGGVTAERHDHTITS